MATAGFSEKTHTQHGADGVVDERFTSDGKLLPVESELQHLNDVCADGMLGVEAFGPVDQGASGEGGLSDGEAEGEA